METQENKNQVQETQNKKWYDKYYRILLLIPVIVLILSLIYLVNFQIKEGDIIYKDVTLTGGTSITVFDSDVLIDDVKSSLSSQFPDIVIRAISDFRTAQQKGFILETQAPIEQIKPTLEKFLGYELTQENSSVEFSGEVLSSRFYQQLRSSIIVAFLLMGWVIFFIFGSSRKIKGIALMLTALALSISFSNLSIIKFFSVTGVIAGFVLALIDAKRRKEYIIVFSVTAFAMLLLFINLKEYFLIPLGIILVLLYGFYSVPSIAVIFAAFADIVMTLAVVNLSEMSLSTAGIIAFLMLIGYSVDTDILLTSRVLKKKEEALNQRIYGAFKTGLTMTLTSIVAIAVSLLVVYNSSEVLRQIFTILLIGLFFDIFNTWLTNASIIKWYVERKEAEK